MSMMVSFVLSFFPRYVLDEILNLIESVSEDFPSYSYILSKYLSALNAVRILIFGYNECKVKLGVMTHGYKCCASHLFPFNSHYKASLWMLAKAFRGIVKYCCSRVDRTARLWYRKAPEGREIAPVYRHPTPGHSLSLST